MPETGESQCQNNRSPVICYLVFVVLYTGEEEDVTGKCLGHKRLPKSDFQPKPVLWNIYADLVCVFKHSFRVCCKVGPVICHGVRFLKHLAHLTHCTEREQTAVCVWSGPPRRTSSRETTKHTWISRQGGQGW